MNYQIPTFDFEAIDAAYARTDRLSLSQQDHLCQAVGGRCIHCTNPLPTGEDAPRVCPAATPETCHEIARILYTNE